MSTLSIKTEVPVWGMIFASESAKCIEDVLEKAGGATYAQRYVSCKAGHFVCEKPVAIKKESVVFGRLLHQECIFAPVTVSSSGVVRDVSCSKTSMIASVVPYVFARKYGVLLFMTANHGIGTREICTVFGLLNRLYNSGRSNAIVGSVMYGADMDVSDRIDSIEFNSMRVPDLSKNLHGQSIAEKIQTAKWQSSNPSPMTVQRALKMKNAISRLFRPSLENVIDEGQVNNVDVDAWNYISGMEIRRVPLDVVQACPGLNTRNKQQKVLLEVLRHVIKNSNMQEVL